MTLDLRAPAANTLPSSKEPLYTVPEGKVGSFRVSLLNTASVAIRCYLYTSRLGVSSIMEDVSLDPRDTYHGNYEELEGGDKIEGHAAAASLVVYRIKGWRTDS